MRVTGYHLAQLNVGIVRAPIDSPEMAGFMAGIEPVNAIADAAPGFVWRLQDGDGPGATALRPRGPDFMVNMSVWESLEALRDFVYRNGPHLDFMRRRREWFHRMAEQHLVLWWVPPATSPAWTRRCPGSTCSSAMVPAPGHSRSVSLTPRPLTPSRRGTRCSASAPTRRE